MPRVREKQLARLAARANAADDVAAWRIATLRARVKVGAILRDALAQLQIAPAVVAMLRICDEAEQELAMTANCREKHAITAVFAGEEVRDGSAVALSARIDVLVQRYGNGRGIDFARASLAEALGWCGARLE
jgi:hypothetical protein